jgi:hypothetical protein
MSDVANFTRALLGQGLGMGWGDEAEAYLRSFGSGDYDRKLSEINKDYGQFVQQHPIAAPLTEFAGGMLPLAASYFFTPATGGGAAPVAAISTARQAGTLGRIASSIWKNPVLKNALIGGATGAITGMGTSQPGERIPGSISGAMIGAPLGAAAPLVLHGSGTGMNWLTERLAPTESRMERVAADKINAALRRSKNPVTGAMGMIPEEAAQIVKRDRNIGIPSTFANVSEPLVNLTEAAAQRTGLGAERIASKLGKQVYGGETTPSSRQRIYNRTKDALGGKDYADIDFMKRELRTKAEPLYEKAYEFGPVNDPEINRLLETPQFQKFYKEARKIADIHALTADDPNKFRLKNIYAVSPKGNVVVKELPDVRTLDWIKRGLDATIEKGYAGKGMSTAKASALRDLRSKYMTALDKATERNGVSDYANARVEYAGDMEVMDAYRKGKKDFGQMRRQDIETTISGMTPAEKDAFSTGVMNHIYGRIMVPSSNINAGQKILGEISDKISPLFESQSKFDLFKSAITREKQLLENAHKISGNSATLRRQLASKSFEDNSGVGETIVDMVTGGPIHALGTAAMRFARNINVTDKMAGKVSQMLMSSEPDEVAAAVKLLEKYGAQSSNVSGKLSKADTGVAMGLAIAAQPDPETPTEPRNIEKDMQGLDEAGPNIPGRVIGSTEAPRRDIEAALKKLEEEESAARPDTATSPIEYIKIRRKATQ